MVSSTRMSSIILVLLLSSHNIHTVVMAKTSPSLVSRERFDDLVPRRDVEIAKMQHARSISDLKLPRSSLKIFAEKKSEESIMIRPLSALTKKQEEDAEAHASQQHELILQAIRGNGGKRDLQTDACQSEIDSAVACVVTFASSCDFNCFGQPSSQTCSGLEDQLCSGIDTCGCSLCEAEILTAYSCGSPCTYQCEGSSTISDECQPLFDSAGACLSIYPSCDINCFSDYQGQTCTQAEMGLCSDIDNCGCSLCEAEILTALSCESSCGTLQCDQATEAPDECGALLDTTNQCVSTSNPSCAACINDVVDEIEANNPDGLLCSSFGNQVCAGFATCGCETCESELLGFYECAFGCSYLSPCGDSQPAPLPSAPAPVFPSSTPAPVAPRPPTNPPLVTATVAPTKSPPLPTGAPVVPPTIAPTPACPEELSIARACAETQGSCSSCIDGTIDGLTEGSCSAAFIGICQAIKTDCDCGDCRQYLEDYFSCALLLGCPNEDKLDCQLDATSSPTKAPFTAAPTVSPTKAPVTPSEPSASQIETEPGAPTIDQPDEKSPNGIIGGNGPVSSTFRLSNEIAVIVSLVVGSLASMVIV